MLNIPLEWLQTPAGKPDPSADAEARLEASDLHITYARIGWATYGLVVEEDDVDRIGRTILQEGGRFPWRLAICNTRAHRYSPRDLIRELETIANERAKEQATKNLFILGDGGAISHSAFVP
jgi:hypothetical protein